MSCYVILLFICAGMLLTLAMLAGSRRQAAPGSWVLFALLLGIGIANFAYAMNLSATGLEAKLFWNRVEYLGGAAIPVLMLVVALAVVGRDRWLRPWRLAALLTVPAIALLANWSNAWHGLYYARTWLEPCGAQEILAKERGPIYVLQFGYAYAVIGAALFIILRALRRSGKAARPQLVLLLAAFLIPFLLNVPYTLRLMPNPHVNLTLPGFFFSAFLLNIALFRFRLLSSVPMDMEERNQLLLNHAHALFYTVDPDGVFTYVSPNWPQLLGHTPEEVVGRSFTVFVVPEDHAACSAFLERVVATGTLQTGAEYRVVHKDGHVVWHTSSIMPVKDRKGGLLAYVGAAHDITSLKQTQRELSVANERLSQLVASRESELRRAISETLTAAESEDRRIGEEIHDGLCQELIGLARLAETVETPPDRACQPCRHALDEIRRHAARLAGVARVFAHDLALHELEIQTLPEALETLARRTDVLFRTETELNLPGPLPPLSRERNLHVYRIVREAVANAVKHGQAKRLWIDLVREPRQLVISISNDGRPLPEPARLVESFGMKQMRMRTRLLGGTFAIRRNPQGQTVAELVVPLEGEPA